MATGRTGEDAPGPPPRASKSDAAFRTIGELSAELGVAQHILRYWETRFAQLRPLQRAGNRRYYRPADVALVRRIDALLNREGYTVRGVQQLLARGEPVAAAAPPPASQLADPQAALWHIRTLLSEALAADR